MSERNSTLATRIEELVVSRTRTEKHDWAIEPQLLLSKWPEYHFLSPHAATTHFAAIYREKSVKRFAQTFGSNRPEEIKGYDDQRLEAAGREYTSMNRARQMADDLGMRYEEFISLSFEFWFNRKRKRLPRPNQLGPVGLYAAAWNAYCGERWSDRLPHKLMRVDLDPYRLEKNQNLPAQRSFRALTTSVVRKNGPGTFRDRVAYWTLRERILPFVRFRSSMRLDQFLDLRDDLKDEFHTERGKRSPRSAQNEITTLQSCCGLPGARDPQAAPCAFCAQSEACVRIAAFIEKEVIRRTGSSEPKLQARRALDNERQRKCRARKKEAAAMSLEA